MKYPLLFIAILDLFCAKGQSSYGPNSPGTFSTNNGIGSVAWNNVIAGDVSDNSYATASVSLGLLSSANTHYLTATGFGFSIPSGASITGIKVEIEKRYSVLLGVLSSISDNAVRLIKGGLISGNNKAAGAWSSSDTYSSYGGSSDTWGQSWSPADINSASFGVAISASISSGLSALTLEALVDHFRVTIYFNIPVPVRLVSFHAQATGENVILNWSTLTESGSRRFFAEKWDDLIEGWFPFDSLPAAGESFFPRHYSVIDHNPPEMGLYRIREEDQNGNIHYSRVAKTQLSDAASKVIHLTPNPSEHFVSILSHRPMTEISIVSPKGRICGHYYYGASVYQSVLLLDHLPSGIYFLHIYTADKQVSRKQLIKR